MTKYHSGSTIRLQGTFRTLAGELTDVTAPTVKIYKEPDRTTPIVTKTGSDVTHDSTGVYHYDYTASSIGTYIYEFSGTAAGVALLDRGVFYVDFLTDKHA